jgi:NAD(P)-dependent dehydrogenase (short-subunit alcohol dehydrogenase family)
MTPDRSFAGRTVVLTGASAGIGRELALQLAPERPRLVLAARTTDRLEEVAAGCRDAGAEVLIVPTDVGDKGACEALVASAVERFGGIDMLLLNAGQEMWARLDELTDLSVLERLMRVNYFGCVWPTVAALPHLMRRRGRIVVVSSLAGLTGVPTRSGYCAAKHALHGFFDSLRIELDSSGVTVTLVCPDFVLSELHRRSLGPDGNPLGVSPMNESRITTASECARDILAAARRRRRLSLLSLRGRLGRWVRLVAPGFIDGIARRSVARGH